MRDNYIIIVICDTLKTAIVVFMELEYYSVFPNISNNSHWNSSIEGAKRCPSTTTILCFRTLRKKLGLKNSYCWEKM